MYILGAILGYDETMTSDLVSQTFSFVVRKKDEIREL